MRRSLDRCLRRGRLCGLGRVGIGGLKGCRSSLWYRYACERLFEWERKRKVREEGGREQTFPRRLPRSRQEHPEHHALTRIRAGWILHSGNPIQERLLAVRLCGARYRRSRDKQDRRSLPLEYPRFERAHAEPGFGPRVQQAEPPPKAIAGDEERELAEEVYVQYPTGPREKRGGFYVARRGRGFGGHVDFFAEEEVLEKWAKSIEYEWLIKG